MNNIEYEKFNLNQNLPALLIYFDKEIIEEQKRIYIPAHWHRSIEMTFILEGEVFGIINGDTFRVKKGEFIFINSGEVHEMTKYSKDKCSGVILILSYDFIKKVYPNIDNIYLDIMNADIINERLYEIFFNLKRLAINSLELDYLKINSYIYELLYILLKDHKSLKIEHSNTENYFNHRDRQKEILTYINDNYNEELTLERISKHFFMSHEYFSRKFHEWFGITYKVHLSNVRLYKSYEDIIYTEKNIQDIAFSHGFSNVKSFINIFKQKYDMTPLKYRQYINESRNNNKMNKK